MCSYGVINCPQPRAQTGNDKIELVFATRTRVVAAISEESSFDEFPVARQLRQDAERLLSDDDKHSSMVHLRYHNAPTVLGCGDTPMLVPYGGIAYSNGEAKSGGGAYHLV